MVLDRRFALDSPRASASLHTDDAPRAEPVSRGAITSELRPAGSQLVVPRAAHTNYAASAIDDPAASPASANTPAPNDVATMAFLAWAAYRQDGATLAQNLSGSGWNILRPQADLGVSTGDASGQFFEKKILLTLPIPGLFPVVVQAGAFVAYNGDTLAISFRGTQEGSGKFYEKTPELEAAAFNQTDYFAVYTALITATLSYATTHGFSKLLVTGHSLGGAMAEWFAVKAAPLFAQAGLTVSVATIGSPGTPASLGTNAYLQHALEFGNTADPVFQHSGMLSLFEGMLSHGGTAINVNLPNVPNNVQGSGYYEHDQSLYVQSMRALNESMFASRYLAAPGNRQLVIDTLRSPGDERPINLSWSTTPLLIIGQSDFSNGCFPDADTITGGLAADWIDGGADNDTISGGLGDDILAGGDGSDSLAGGSGSDEIYGGSGVDFIEGGDGNDTMAGGLGGDRYSIGLYQGHDVIDDTGDSTIDTIAVSTGTIFGAINYSWFSKSGNDLLVQAYDSYGALALDVRIVNMGTTGGQIEHFDLYAGDGTQLTQSWDLGQVWSQLNEPNAPPTPTPPAPTVPSSPSAFSWIGTSGPDVMTFGSGNDVVAGLAGSDALGGGGGNDVILGGAGGDVLSGGDGNDVLVDDDSSASLGGDYIDGGSGSDQLVFYGAAAGDSDTGIGGSGSDLALVDLRNRTADWRASSSGNSLAIHPENTGLEGAINLHDDIETVAILFGSGDDHVSGGDEVDYFDGGNGNDQLDGGSGDDSLLGGNGDDRLHCDTGGWIDGGSGFDGAYLNLSSVSQNLTFLEDQAFTASGFTFLDGTHVQNVEEISDLQTGSGDDQLWFGTGYIRVASGGGNDILTTQGHGDESVDGGSGADRLAVDYSWATDHVRTRWNSGTQALWTFVGASTAQNSAHVVAQNVEQFQITGGSNGDYLTGRAGDDVLIGNGGDDQLDGAAGANTLVGGNGDDAFESGQGVDWIDGGDGFDLLELGRQSSTGGLTFDQNAASSDIGFTLVDGTFVKNVEQLHLWLGSGNNAITLTGHGDNFLSLSSGTNRLTIDYSWSSQAISTTYDSGQYSWYGYVGASENINAWMAGFVPEITLYVNITGGTGDDQLQGFRQDDTLAGGPGNDTLDGSDGADTASYANATGGVTVDLALAGPQSIGAGQGADTLVSIENVAGSAFADSLSGTNGDNVITGNSGNDVIRPGMGTDTVAAGDGDDQIIFTNGRLDAADLVDGGDGADMVWLNGDYTGANAVVFNATTMVNVETIGLAASNSYNLTTVDATVGVGNTLTVDASGFAASKTLTFDGSAETNGAFRITGGAGGDNIYGGWGNDTLYGRSGNDTLRPGLGNDIASGGDGDDTITFTGGRLTASDIVDGGAGTDMVWLNGDYAGGNAVVFNATTVTNIESIALAGGFSYSLKTVEATVVAGKTLTVDGSGLGASNALTFDGSAETNGGFQIIGGAGADTLIGGNGPDTLTGRAGNDALRPGWGADFIYGGDGDDTISFTNGKLSASDVVDGGAGTDMVWLNGDYSGANAVVFNATTITNVETIGLAAGYSYDLKTVDATVASGKSLTIDGSSLTSSKALSFNGSAETNGSFQVIGGAGADTITGGSGNDTLSGRAGNDTLRAGQGTDSVYGGDGDDTISFTGGRLNATDIVDGGAGWDTVWLNGDYAGANAVTFNATTMTNVESIGFAAGFNYTLKTSDGTVAPGKALTIDASALGAANVLTFDGSAETNGAFTFVSGSGGDSFTGGSGADTFKYDAASRSTGLHYDTINALNFANDNFDIPGAITTIDAAKSTGALSTASFDTDLATALSSLGAHHAMLFTPNAGSLSGQTFMVVDCNGTAGYQAGQDLVIRINGYSGALTAGVFH